MKTSLCAHKKCHGIIFFFFYSTLLLHHEENPKKCPWLLISYLKLHEPRFSQYIPIFIKLPIKCIKKIWQCSDLCSSVQVQLCQPRCVMPSLTCGQTVTYFWARQRSLPLWMMARQPEPNSFISQLNSADASHHILLTIPWLHHKDKLSQSAPCVSVTTEGPSVITSLDGGPPLHIHLWLAPFRWFRQNQ